MRIFSVARATAFYDFGNNVAEDFGALRTAENHNLKFVLFAERGERNFADFGNGFADGHSGQNGFNAGRRIFYLFETLGDESGVFAEKAIGSAHDRILFMNDQVGAEQNGRHAAWERSVAAEADDTGGFLFENQASGLQNADGSLNQAFDFEQAGFADQSAGQNRMIGNFAEAALVIVFAAAVGYQFDAIAAAQQFVSQRFGRINMAAGAAGRENNQGFPSFLPFLVADIFVLRMNIFTSNGQEHAHSKSCGQQ